MLVAVNRISKSNPIVIAIINFAMKMHNYGKNFVFSQNFTYFSLIFILFILNVPMT